MIGPSRRVLFCGLLGGKKEPSDPIYGATCKKSGDDTRKKNGDEIKSGDDTCKKMGSQKQARVNARESRKNRRGMNETTREPSCNYCYKSFPTGQPVYVWSYRRICHEMDYGTMKKDVCGSCAAWIDKQSYWNTTTVELKQ